MNKSDLLFLVSKRGKSYYIMGHREVLCANHTDDSFFLEHYVGEIQHISDEDYSNIVRLGHRLSPNP